uniref:Adenosine deaminase RNA specific B2 (inactive) n=1 Tax=Callorhinchus milii TaxID=7868 RepID=A0A4W3GNH5_CALMI
IQQKKTPCERLALSGDCCSGARQPGKSPSVSINWTLGDSDLEVINATTGKGALGCSSRLCKRALYSRWAKLYGKVRARRPLAPQPRWPREAKLAAESHQAVKQQLFKALQKAGLGTWVRKPPEQDYFLLAL